MGPSQMHLPAMQYAGGSIGAPLVCLFSQLTANFAATPRLNAGLHVTFVQMGGNIDKDFPVGEDPCLADLTN